MRPAVRLALPLLAAAGILACGYAVAPASATPAGFAPIARPDSGVAETRMRRRHHHRRRMRAVKSENSRFPERMPGQQNTGQTSGGPRY